MKVYIAEKKDAAEKIAESDTIGGIQDRRTKKFKKDGNEYTTAWAYECPEDVVITWLAGHALRTYNPEEIKDAWDTSGDDDGWRFDYLPMLPDSIPKKPSYGWKQDLDRMESLVEKANTIVHAGDVEREGQLIVDEVLEYFGIDPYGDSVKRILPNSINEGDIDRVVQEEYPNAEYERLSEAAQTRSEADWLLGMNITQAMSIAAWQTGFDFSGGSNFISVGRVQTPVLALVVDRDREIENFEPTTYYVLRAGVQAGENQKSWFILDVPDDEIEEGRPGFNHNGKLVDQSIARDILDTIEGDTLRVTNVGYDKTRKKPPRAPDLSDVQIACSKIGNLSSEQTLDAAQELYGDGYISYPRVDCQYIPESEKDKAPDVLSMLSGLSFPNADQAQTVNPFKNHRSWNDDKIEDHYAIIPTGKDVPYNRFSDRKQLVFSVIAQRYIQLFMGPYVYEKQFVNAEAGGEEWLSKRQRVARDDQGNEKLGWRVMRDNSNLKRQSFLDVQQGDTFTVADTDTVQKETDPPKRFTEHRLISAMKNIVKYIDIEDEQMKSFLSDANGLGTSATRASILSKLVEERDYLYRKGSQVRATDMGRDIIDFIRSISGQVASPRLTAYFEQLLDQIKSGEYTRDKFIDMIHEMVAEIVENARDYTRSGSGTKAKA